MIKPLSITAKDTGTVKKRVFKEKMSTAKVQMRMKQILGLVLRYALIICLSYMILYPILQMVSTSLKHPYDIGSLNYIWVPKTFTLDNIIVAWFILDYPKRFMYTFICTSVVVLLQIFNSAFAGYALARLRFKGSNLLLGLVIFTIIVPSASLALPQYVYFRNFDIFGIFSLVFGHKLNLLGKPTSMYMLAALGQGLSSGLFVYIFRQFFRGLPKELEEAAYVDGAGYLHIFLRIVLPASKPGIMTVGVLSFIWNWNDTRFISLFNPTDLYFGMRMNSLGSAKYQVLGAVRNAISKIPPWVLRLDNDAYSDLIYTACKLLVILPIIIFFFIVQKQFIEGVERSGITG